MGQILGRMLSVFYYKRLEVALVGLEVGFDRSVVRFGFGTFSVAIVVLT